MIFFERYFIRKSLNHGELICYIGDPNKSDVSHQLFHDASSFHVVNKILTLSSISLHPNIDMKLYN